jgi:beta-lactamase superfamily II metal-dependent hydrolase
VNFIDVGQGDGCHIVTPDDRHFLIDAGKSDNMFRFLRWRFNLKDASVAPPPFTVVVSHSDTDHYQGFGEVFTPKKEQAQQISIEKIYHNGIVEASGSDSGSLGTIVEANGRKYVTDLCDTPADYEKRAKSLKEIKKNGLYVNTLNKVNAPKQSLREGSAPIYDNCGLKIEVLGPVAEKVNGKDALPYFGSIGETKNGHSVILKLTMGKLRLLLGGDLNTKSEHYLLQHYSGVDVKSLVAKLEDKKLTDEKRKELEAKLENAIVKARKALEVDIAKSCHHGSADFSTEFLRAVNPIATIISSGDDEPYAHPRPDTLGTIGKHSRGKRSLIFSTELARSGKEFVEVAKLKDSDKKRERVVTVYGMINVRADGEKAIIAQKLEKVVGKTNWDIHRLEWNAAEGAFEYIQD